ncbi:hypothetical protein AB2N08_15235 [Massilia aurea]|uniref:hypothetical protein n=1 Tax=Massilia aurea TaxID=373040 RepID=UPI0034629EC2
MSETARLDAEEHKIMKKLGFVLTAAVMLSACSPDSSLSETKIRLADANLKITALEKELAEAKATTKSTRSAGTPSVKGESAPTTPVKPSAESIGQQWQYDISEDAMSGKKRYTATVRSSNTASFGFPYSGAQHGTLTLRAQGKGKDVLFYIERGQILCPSYQGCRALVRFDDEKPIRFAANGPADHSSETIFLSDESSFLNKLKKAKRIRLAVDIYQNGAPAFEFDVSGFDQDKFQPKL